MEEEEEVEDEISSQRKIKEKRGGIWVYKGGEEEEGTHVDENFFLPPPFLPLRDRECRKAEPIGSWKGAVFSSSVFLAAAVEGNRDSVRFNILFPLLRMKGGYVGKCDAAGSHIYWEGGEEAAEWRWEKEAK